jgi:phosphoribosyl-ATP pyrophosphohydrolase/phosphoribosyl-AMP cyclohydrolase
LTDRSLRTAADLEALRFDDRGLLPVVAQDATTARVLMVAWANQEALARSLATRELHFWSRSRRSIWRKGETSGNVLRLRSLHADCDGDTVLGLVDPTGPACHTGEESCFGEGTEGTASADAALDRLWSVIAERARTRPEGSYTTRLLGDENLRLKKLGEETAELVTALARADRERIPEEAADLIYHLLAALRGADVELAAVLEALAGRRR